VEAQEGVLDDILGGGLGAGQQQGHADQAQAVDTEQAGNDVIRRLAVPGKLSSSCHINMTPQGGKC